MKPAAWNYKDRNAAGWLHMWDLTLQTVWGRTPWERAAPRNAPSRGVRPQHDLGTVDRRGGPLLPLSAYDIWLPDVHPRAAMATLLRADPDDVAILVGSAGAPDSAAWFRYPTELCLARRPPAPQASTRRALTVQESGNFPSPAAEDARNYASMVLFEKGKPVASSVDADKTSSGLLRYTTVAPTHRGQGLATALWVLTHECGIPAWRISDEWFDMEAQNNRIHVGMMRPLLKAHALCILRAGARGVELRADVMASARNWESYSEELMAKAEAEKSAVMRSPFPGWQPPTAKQKKEATARRERRAEAKAAAGPRRAPRPGRGVSVDAAMAVTEELQAATAEAREVAEELGELLESLPPEAAAMFRAMRDEADESDDPEGAEASKTEPPINPDDK